MSRLKEHCSSIIRSLSQTNTDYNRPKSTAECNEKRHVLHRRIVYKLNGQHSANLHWRFDFRDSLSLLYEIIKKHCKFVLLSAEQAPPRSLLRSWIRRKFVRRGAKVTGDDNLGLVAAAACGDSIRPTERGSGFLVWHASSVRHTTLNASRFRHIVNFVFRENQPRCRLPPGHFQCRKIPNCVSINALLSARKGQWRGKIVDTSGRGVSMMREKCAPAAKERRSPHGTCVQLLQPMAALEDFFKHHQIVSEKLTWLATLRNGLLYTSQSQRIYSLRNGTVYLINSAHCTYWREKRVLCAWFLRVHGRTSKILPSIRIDLNSFRSQIE